MQSFTNLQVFDLSGIITEKFIDEVKEEVGSGNLKLEIIGAKEIGDTQFYPLNIDDGHENLEKLALSLKSGVSDDILTNKTLQRAVSANARCLANSIKKEIETSGLSNPTVEITFAPATDINYANTLGLPLYVFVFVGKDKEGKLLVKMETESSYKVKAK